MNTILTIYGQSAFKRYLLPAINDADYVLYLSKTLFDLERTVPLKLEVVNNEWSFVPSDDYRIVLTDGTEVSPNNASLRKLVATGHSTLRLRMAGRQVAAIIIRMTDQYFASYEHFQLSTRAAVSIGREPDNMVAFNRPSENLLSGHHARIVNTGGQWVIEDSASANGTFVNGKRIAGAAPLRFADCIDLFGLRIVFLGDELAINVHESGSVVRGLTRAVPATSTQAVPSKGSQGESLEKLYHRAPRQVARIDTDTVKIDEAPQARDSSRNASFLGAIGGALAMALPMFLGCAFMVYASNESGINRGLFMYVGLVTAVASAIMGSVRSIAAIRQARREMREYEAKRNERYGRYLKEREELIRFKYEKNASILREQYRSAEHVCTYTTENPLLWSKNATQDDFLTHRVGTGDMPFQVKIETPARRFTLADNALAELPDQIKANYATLKDVPLSVDLLKDRLVGIVGGRNLTGAIGIAYSLVAQIAATNSYTEVKLVFVYDEQEGGAEDTWGFARWLPHVWNETRTFRYVATNAEEASDVFFELNKVMRERAEDKGRSFGREGQLPKPYYVLVLASPELLEGELMARYALRPDEAYGLTTLYLAERYERLPNECEFVIENDEQFRGYFHTYDNIDERTPVVFDNVGREDMERLAGSLANVRVVEPQTGGEVPQLVSFFDLYGVRRPEELGALMRWKKNRTYESMRVPIGERAGGALCYLDIHEKYHGPHGLVAGTTGSGKSETLQTYMLSLAVNFSPDDVSFFVIDYKGGGMAGLFEGLPHLIGQISNLSGSQVNRALVSIQSEKNRREAIFSEYGVKDIRDYTKLVKSGEAKVPVPHLIIVIDEFAEMKVEEPEFIQEIVSVSRVGRSLGIHLIMATQRPAGAVSEDIWANSRFKLCLRVQSRQDSADMLHKPDAAYLTQSGRCYLQVGNDELFELFQSGYSGATYSADDRDAGADIATMLNASGVPSLVGNHARILRQREKKREWVALLLDCVRESGVGDPQELTGCSRTELEAKAEALYGRLEAHQADYPRSDFNTEALIAFLEQVGQRGFDVEALAAIDDEAGTKARLPQQPERSQLEAVVGYLRAVAEQNGYDRDYSLFLPLLPQRLVMRELPRQGGLWGSKRPFDGNAWHRGARPSLAVGLGLFDDPLNQRQDTYVVDLLRDGNLAVFGGPQTGKSTLLQTFVYGLITNYDPSEVNVYAIEYSARKFSALERAPHVGGVVRDGDDLDHLDKLFTTISKLRDERKRVLGDASFVQYLESKGTGALPAIVLVIDNYASLAQRTNDRYATFLRTLTKEGAAYGIFVAMSALGVGSGECPNSLATNFRTVVCLELPNAYDYGTYLRRTRLRMTPEPGVAGRGICIDGDRPLEFQTALPLAVDDELVLGERLRTIAQTMDEAWDGRHARHIPLIPEEPLWDDFVRLDTVQDLLTQGDVLPLGYDARYAEPFGVDLASTYVWNISGAKRKGKTNTLRVLARSAKALGGRVVFVDYPGASERFAKSIEAEYIANEAEFLTFMMGFKDLVTERNQAKQKIVATGAEEREIYEAMCSFEPIFIFIDDLPSFVERAYHPSMPLENTFEQLLTVFVERCTYHNIFWFVSIDREKQGTAPSYDLFKAFVRDKKGVHLGGRAFSTAAAGMNFENHDRRTVDNPLPVGRGLLPSDDESEVLEVVIPLAGRGAK